MASVAQKTRFLLFITIFSLFITQINQANALSDVRKSENITYKVTLNGVSLGEAVISYTPNNEKNSYKLLAKVKTKGFADKLYNINDNIIVNGAIINGELEPKNNSVVLKEGKYRFNKTIIFEKSKDLLTFQNNETGENRKIILLNKAKDLFSSLYSLRFNTDLNNTKAFEFNETMQFAQKTFKTKINVSAPFNHITDKENRIKARNVVLTSQRVRIKALSDEKLALIETGKRSAKNFTNQSIKKIEEPIQNIKVIISSDERKTPLIIHYASKFGTFKAVLSKYN